jgi:hypothetical protein
LMVLAFVILQSVQKYSDKEESTLFYIKYGFLTIRISCNLGKHNSVLNDVYSIK